MGIKSLVGYVLSLGGLFGLAMTYEPLAKKIPVTLPATLSGTTLFIVSAVLLIIGIFVVMTSKGSSRRTKKGKELPIFQGKEVVGYRKH